MEVHGSTSAKRVEPNQLYDVWPLVSKKLHRGLKHADITETDLIHGIMSGSMVLWVIHDGGDPVAVVVIELIRRANHTTLLVVLVAGRDFHKHQNYVQRLLKDYAELNGASSIKAIVRPGMRKWLEELGWCATEVVMEMKDG